MHTARPITGKAQMQVIEIITAGLVLLAAMNFAAQLSAPLSPPSQSYQQLDKQGTSSLAAMDHLPSDAGYSSLLDECLSTGDITTISEFLNLTLNVTISYNLYLYPAEFSASPLILITSGGSIGEATTSHYPAIISESAVLLDLATGDHVAVPYGLYDLVLLMWYEPRTGVAD